MTLRDVEKRGHFIFQATEANPQPFADCPRRWAFIDF